MSGRQQVQVRQEVVTRVQRQLASGTYDPPVEELVDRLVGIVMGRRASRRPEVGE